MSGNDWVCQEVKVVSPKRHWERAIIKTLNLVSLVFGVVQPLTGFGCLHSLKLVKTMEV